jgi:hypothetical protein
MTTAATLQRVRVSPLDIVLRVLAVAGLAVSAYVHLHLAHLYTTLGDTITQGDLFRVQGVVSAVVAVWLLVTGQRLAWLTAGVVSALSLGAVMLYRYVNVGAIGPIPNMHDASWQPSPDKMMSAIAEAAVVVLALVWWVAVARRRERQPAFSSSP